MEQSWSRQFVVLVVAAILAFAFVFTYASIAESKGGTCATWASELGAGRDDYDLHLMGCDANVRGTYHAYSGYCAKLARSFARSGERGIAVAQLTSARAYRINGYDRCTIFEDGTYTS